MQITLEATGMPTHYEWIQPYPTSNPGNFCGVHPGGQTDRWAAIPINICNKEQFEPLLL
jgi:hypothetical protein